MQTCLVINISIASTARLTYFNHAVNRKFNAHFLFVMVTVQSAISEQLQACCWRLVYKMLWQSNLLT